MKNLLPVILAVFVIVSVAAMTYIFYDSNRKIHRLILQSEINLRDSLSKKIVILAAKSDSLEQHIKMMSDSFNVDRAKLSKQINNLRYEIPKLIDYSILSDSALLRRLSGH
jgi:Tfp pilus assembly protein PilN